MQITNTIISENINEAQLHVLLRIKGAWGKKEHQEYFHQVTSAHAQGSDLPCKRWSLLQNGSVNVSRSTIRLLLLWALCDAGHILQHLCKSRPCFPQGLYQNSQVSTRRDICTACLTYPTATQDDLSTHPSSQSWSSQSNLPYFCLFLLSLQILVLTCTCFSRWSILSVYLPGRQSAQKVSKEKKDFQKRSNTS